MDEIKSMEKLRDGYYISLKDVDEKDVLGILPLPGQKNFNDLIKGLLFLLRKDLDAALALRPTATDIDDIKDLDKDIDNYSRKLKIITNYIEFCTNDLNNDQLELDEDKPCNIICCRFDNGNCPLIRDLKSIPKEFYPQILELLNKLENGELDYNPEKTKRMSGNSKLKGITEIKGFKGRIFFKVLPNNTIYIEMIRLKKDNHSLRDSKEPIERKYNIRTDCKRLTNQLKKHENEVAIASRSVDYEELKKYINSKIKKGEKKKNGKRHK